MRTRLTDDPKRLISAASSGNGRREIPDDFKYNTKKLKHLKAILHNVSVALGTLSSAFNEFSRFKGPEISPDGRLGGAGYILPIKDIKQSLQNSIYSLSDVADCLADELNNPKWDVKDDKDVKKLIKEKEEAVEQVEEIIEKPEEDDSSDDITNTPKEPEETEEKPEESQSEETPTEESVEPPQSEEKTEDKPDSEKSLLFGSVKKASDVYAKAVRQSLVDFIENT